MIEQHKRVLLRLLVGIALLSSAIAIWGGRVARAAEIDRDELQPTRADLAVADATGWPEWVEPRGASVVELVGQIPEEDLHGMIISSSDWNGIVVYESGSRVGNTVVITTTIYPRLHEADWAPGGRATLFNCLGQRPIFDHMGSMVPASTMRIYDASGLDVTAEIVFLYVVRMDSLQPLANSRQYVRYPEDGYGPLLPNPLPLGPDGLHIPANSGCKMIIGGKDYFPLTGVFTFTLEPSVRATVVGVQQAEFQSYIGPGELGIFAPLMEQMEGRYGDRHDRIPLSVPAGANYFLVKFPPMPGDAYADCYSPNRWNANRPSGGTYRLSDDDLSADLVFSAGFPLEPGWQDADQAPGTRFLPLLSGPEKLAAPEYVLPAGIPFNNCFWQGSCPGGLLDQIYDTVMTLEVFFLSVSKPAGKGEWVSLKMAGPAWSPSGPGSQPAATATGEVTSRDAAAESGSHTVFLPYVSNYVEELPPGGCPCGWFDAAGRMLYYLDSSE